MSAITKEQNAKVSKFFDEFWKKMVKPYYNPEDKKEWWDELRETANSLMEKYGKGDQRMLGLVHGYYCGVEETARGIEGVETAKYIRVSRLLNPLNNLYKAIKLENMEEIKKAMDELLLTYNNSRKVELSGECINSAVLFKKEKEMANGK